jgi:HlyD family secretion protein
MKTLRIRWYPIAGIALLALMGVSAIRLLRADPSNSPRPSDVAEAARTARTPLGAADEREMARPAGAVSAPGVVEPRGQQTNLGAPVAGRIANVMVVEGQKVQQGDPLIELDSAMERAALAAASAERIAAQAHLLRTLRGSRTQDIEAAAADANAARSRADLATSVAERSNRLAQTGAVALAEVERANQEARAEESAALAAEARAHAVLSGSRREDVQIAHAQSDAAEARRDQAQAALDRLIVRAPLAGEILQVLVRAGEYHLPGTGPLIVMGDTRELRVRMDVDERDVGRVKVGASVTARANAFPGVDFSGKVVELGRRMGRKNVRTDDPTERNDTKILEVLVALDAPRGLIVGQRVTCFVQ